MNIARSLWADTTFRDPEMSQREAWIWLIKEAAWKPRVQRIGTKEIKLVRAQVAASTRFLASAWMWSEPKVRRYLNMLENRHMIMRVTDAGLTVITICKYDDYQKKPRNVDAEATQPPTHGQRTADANQNKDEKKIKEEEGARAREADFLILVREAVGIDPADVPRFWIGPQVAEHLERWKAMGLTEAEILAEAKASRGKNPEPSDGPKALDRWMEQAVKAKAAATAPMPEVAKAQAAPKAPMSPEKRLQFFADLINGPGHVPPSMITNTVRDALLAAKLLTPERLRERGIR